MSDFDGGPPTKVLGVDDRPENLLALEAALKPLGLEFLKATSGAEALKLLLRHDVAVILLDVQMPELDGFETAEYVKRREKTRYIPIIFLTAISKESRHVYRGYSTGAVDYLFKPLDPAVLRSKVSVFVDLHRKTTALAESEERFRKTFDHAPIGVALVGLDGRWRSVNRALCNILGHSASRLQTLGVNDLTHPDDPALDLARIRKDLSASDHHMHVDRRFVTSGGDVVDALVSISLVSDLTEDAHLIFQITDISERKRLDEFRNRFVASAAHELRTPASIIAGTTQILEESGRDLAQEDFDNCIATLNRQSDRLVRMMDTMLDLARLREGRFNYTPEPVDLRSLVDQVAEGLPPPAGHSIAIDVEDGIKALADPSALDQVLTNLLANAYRYGGPHISISAHRDDGRISLSVSDDGEGVPPELVDRVFEPFARGKKSVKVGGSGLGLSLVKSLVEAGGGSISYETGEPGGARFVLRLGVG